MMLFKNMKNFDFLVFHKLSFLQLEELNLTTSLFICNIEIVCNRYNSKENIYGC
jgi:hypothetical protein